MLGFKKIPDRAKGSLQEATGSRYCAPFYLRGQPHIVLNSGLTICVRRPTGWTRQAELPGPILSGWAVSKWVVARDRMFGVGNDGSVYELDGDQWKKTYQPPKDLRCGTDTWVTTSRPSAWCSLFEHPPPVRPGRASPDRQRVVGLCRGTSTTTAIISTRSAAFSRQRTSPARGEPRSRAAPAGHRCCAATAASVSHAPAMCA
jgi:hypothetical protein